MKWNAPEQVIESGKTYTATLTTEHGDIVIELYPEAAPETVNSFVFLAQQGYYDDITFHRVLEGFMAQTGDPTGTGSGSPGYTVPAEFDNGLLFDQPGRVGLARAQNPNSGGGQFFITFNETPHLNKQYTVFGQVTEGMDVLRQITLRDPQRNPGFEGDKLISVTVEES